MSSYHDGVDDLQMAFAAADPAAELALAHFTAGFRQH